MNCVRDMVISSEFFNISFYTRLISCLKDTSYNLEVPIVYKSTSEIKNLFFGPVVSTKCIYINNYLEVAKL